MWSWRKNPGNVGSVHTQSLSGGQPGRKGGVQQQEAGQRHHQGHQHAHHIQLEYVLQRENQCCGSVTFWYGVAQLEVRWLAVSRGGRKVRSIDLPILIRSSDFIRQYNRLMSSSDFCIGQLCRFFLSSDFLIVRSCFLVLSSDFCIVRLCRPVLSKKSLHPYFICWQFYILFSLNVGSILIILNFFHTHRDR